MLSDLTPMQARIIGEIRAFDGVTPRHVLSARLGMKADAIAKHIARAKARSIVVSSCLRTVMGPGGGYRWEETTPCLV